MATFKVFSADDLNDITGFPPCHMGCFIKSYSSLPFIYVTMRGFPHNTSLNDRCLAGICIELCMCLHSRYRVAVYETCENIKQNNTA